MPPINFNPMPTGTINGAFLKDTGGYVAGVALDDPGLRFQIEGGIVDPTQTTPAFLWGGLPCGILVPIPGMNTIGAPLKAATTTLGIEAWTVFNQGAGGILTPSSNVPSYSAGQSINYIRPGCNLRLVLPIDPAIINGLGGAPQNTQVSWDFTNNRIMAYNSGVGALPVVIENINTNSKIVTYSGSALTVNWNNAGAVAVVRI